MAFFIPHFKGEGGQSFSITTTDAHDFTRDIHNGMPVLLADSDFNEWLNPKNESTEGLKKLLSNAQVDWLAKQA